MLLSVDHAGWALGANCLVHAHHQAEQLEDPQPAWLACSKQGLGQGTACQPPCAGSAWQAEGSTPAWLQLHSGSVRLWLHAADMSPSEEHTRIFSTSSSNITL